MNRIKYTSPILHRNESVVTIENNVKLYDGDQKTSFEGGELIITTFRIIWARPGQIDRNELCLSLNLSLVVFIEEELPSSFSFSRTRKIVLHLSEIDDPSNGPQPTSIYNFIKLSFREVYSKNVFGILKDLVQQRPWEEMPEIVIESTPQIPSIKPRLGIERSILEKQKATDESINVAFQDLDKLMTMAKEMVRLSKTISTKIKEKQGDITEDETVQFKSYLLSLGIDDPVTRDSFKSDNQYYHSLAGQICSFMHRHIEEMGGMMALTDVFCWVNRARSLELLSPDDILNACRVMEILDLPLKLYTFSSGVMVLQLSSLDDVSVADATSVLYSFRLSSNKMFVTHRLSIEEVNNLLSESFVRIFGNIVEHYPAAAISVLKCRPFSDINSLVMAICDLLDTLKVNEKEVILQQYPDILESLFSCYRPLILEKEAEGILSGTNQLSAEDKKKLLELNARYKEKFGFPFIIGTRKNDIYNVFSEMLLRLQNNREDEILRAMREVKSVVYLRVHEIIR